MQETQREAGLGRKSVTSVVSVGAFSTLGNYEFPRQLQGTSEPLGEVEAGTKPSSCMPLMIKSVWNRFGHHLGFREQFLRILPGDILEDSLVGREGAYKCLSPLPMAVVGWGGEE